MVFNSVKTNFIFADISIITLKRIELSKTEQIDAIVDCSRTESLTFEFSQTKAVLEIASFLL